MSFFKKLTEDFKELKANFDDKGKDKKASESHLVDSSTSSHDANRDTGYSGQQQQQQSFNQPPQHSYPAPPPQRSGSQGQPPLPPGWIAQFDQSSQRWYYVETATGRTQWDVPTQQHGWGAPPLPSSDYPSQQRGHDTGGAAGGFYNQYGHALPAPGQQSNLQHDQNAGQYYGDVGKAEKKKKGKSSSSDKKNLLMAGAGGLAVSGIAGAIIAGDSDSDSEHHSSAPAPSYGGGGGGGYNSAPPAGSYGGDGYGQQQAPPPTQDSDAESLREAQQDYNEAAAAAADSDASSSEQEDLQEAREELEEEQEEYDED